MSRGAGRIVGSPAASHEFLEHTAELRLRVRAVDSRALLAEAGRALGVLILHGEPAEPGRSWRSIEVRSRDREALLVNWLNELLFLAETQLWVPLEFDVLEASDTRVRARARGVSVEVAPTLIKAATFHGLKVVEVDGELQAEVILDI